jgi:DNA polymerase-3 subunit delta
MATTKSAAAFPRPEEILARLEKDPLVPLYLFYGDEPFFVDRATALVRWRLGRTVPVRVFYAGQDALESLLEAWGAPSLFAAQTLVVLKNAEQLKAAERAQLAKEAAWHDAVQPLVVCAHGRVDLTQNFFALCAKKGFAAEFRPLFAHQVPAWAQRLAHERGVRLREDAIHLLSDLVGANLCALAMEIDKLAAFVFPQTEIPADAVEACTGSLYKHTVFDLADAIGQRDRKRACWLLQRVLVDERGALPILHALVSHFRRLWWVKELADSGAAESHIERTVGLRGNRLRAVLGQGRLYTQSDLQRFFHYTALLDVKLKSARTSPWALFQAFILQMCERPT